MQSARDVTIWASELEARRVPPVCVKSGLPADGTWKFPFSTPGHVTYLGAKWFRIPLTQGWLSIFTALIAVRTIALAVALPLYLLSLVLPNAPPELRPIAFTAVGIGFAAQAAEWFSKPRGSLHRLPTGQAWVLLVGVHPAFVDAVNRSRLPEAGLFSADGRWFWDGSRWLNNDFPEQWWRQPLSAWEARPLWQLALGGVWIVAALGALAWWSFHR